MTRVEWQLSLLDQAEHAGLDDEPCLRIGSLLLVTMLDLSKMTRIRYGRMLSDMTSMVQHYRECAPLDVHGEGVGA